MAAQCIPIFLFSISVLFAPSQGKNQHTLLSIYTKPQSISPNCSPQTLGSAETMYLSIIFLGFLSISP